MTATAQAGLHTDRPIVAEIAETGFSIVRGSEIRLGPDVEASFDALRRSYEDLPVDPHMPDGSRYRFRRHSRYDFIPRSDLLVVTENEGYFQTSENNTFAGGVMRKYEELTDEVREGAFMQALIRFSIAGLPARPAERWNVQAHCVRVVARPGVVGRPTPEGMHRDGYTFISLHMVRRHNIAGGATQVFAPDAAPLAETTFTEPMDSFFGEDVRIRHAVTDVDVDDPDLGSGTRDMLLMSYDPV